MTDMSQLRPPLRPRRRGVLAAGAALVAALVSLPLLPGAAGASLGQQAGSSAARTATARTGDLVVPSTTTPPTGVAADPRTGDVYVGVLGGAVYRSRGGRAALTPFAGPDGRQFVNGMKVDGAGRLVLADAQTGRVFVYDTASGDLRGIFDNGIHDGTSFVNDVAVAPSGDVYVTDSYRPVVYRISATELRQRTSAVRPLRPWLDAPESIAIDRTSGFGINLIGAAVTDDGRYLLAATFNTGRLYRVTLADRTVKAVDLHGPAFHADGLVLSGRRGVTVYGSDNALLTVDLSADYLSGRVTRTVDSRLRFPTKVALVGRDVLITNSQLDRVLAGQPLSPPLDVVRLRVPEVRLVPQRVADGFAGPESVWWDRSSRRWYVTNYGGDGFGSGPARDGNGFVSRLRPDGSVEVRTFATGLDTPNGIRGWRGRLLVADLDRLVVIDARTGRTLRTVRVPGARFLNDVAVDVRTGEAYVSDTFTDTVWHLGARKGRLGAGSLDVFVRDARLEGPNGLLVDGSTLLVGNAGPGLDPATFQTTGPGRLLTVDRRTGAITRYGSIGPIGAVDGIEKDRDGYLVTEIGAGQVLRVTRDSVTSLATLGPGQAADLGYDPARRRLAVPALFGTTVTFSRLAGRG